MTTQSDLISGSIWRENRRDHDVYEERRVEDVRGYRVAYSQRLATFDGLGYDGFWPGYTQRIDDFLAGCHCTYVPDEPYEPEQCIREAVELSFRHGPLSEDPAVQAAAYEAHACFRQIAQGNLADHGRTQQAMLDAIVEMERQTAHDINTLLVNSQAWNDINAMVAVQPPTTAENIELDFTVTGNGVEGEATDEYGQA
jgi:hypothetical protein